MNRFLRVWRVRQEELLCIVTKMEPPTRSTTTLVTWHFVMKVFFGVLSGNYVWIALRKGKIGLTNGCSGLKAFD